jgi:hypothetical protein
VEVTPMKSLSSLLVVALLAAAGAAILPSSNVAYAAFHCMRIHAVMAGWNGNGGIQYVELRMNAGGQTVLSGHTIDFYDGSNTLKARFTFPSGVTNGPNVGESVLIATSEFNSMTNGGDADFTFIASGPNTNTVGFNGGDPLHPVQGVNGRVHFAPGFDNCDVGTGVSAGEVDSVAYGTATALYGTTAASALPSPTTNQALILDNISQTPTDNSDEYALGAVSNSTFSVAPANLDTDFATPRNNGRTVLQIAAPVSVGGIAEIPDGAGTGNTSITDDDGALGWITPFLVALGATLALGVLGGLAARRLWSRRVDDR